MRRSISIATALVLCLVLGKGPARAENPDTGVLSGTVNQAPFPGVPRILSAPPNPPAPDPKSGLQKAPDRPPVGTSRPSLGNLFELERQEALLKREISIRKLKDQLKAPGRKKILETGARGTPVTLLAAGFGKKRYAVLAWPDGRRIRVRPGDRLPGIGRVVRIDGSGVSVKRRGTSVTYPYGEDGPASSGSGLSRFPMFSPPPVPSTGGRP